MDLKEEQILGESVKDHWYYRSKSAALLKLVKPLEPRKVLDVGAGSGFFSRSLLSHTSALSACCVDPCYSEEWDERHANKPIYFRQSCIESDADMVLMMDVLEHVEDDLALLAGYVNHVSAGTTFVITVPAFQFLWSGHDVFLGHYRRYTLRGLTDLVERSGLSVERRAFYFGLIFPLVTVLRVIGRLLGRNTNEPVSDLKQYGPLTNGILSMLCRIELPLFEFNHVAGLSVFCVAKKK
jgi:SAM-dependent methyltransferase